MNKQQYFLKLNPPRTSFMMDMSDDEKNIMQAHVAYWMGLLNNGIAIVFGPVMDPAGGYGAGVVSVDDEEPETTHCKRPGKWLEPLRVLSDAGSI